MGQQDREAYLVRTLADAMLRRLRENAHKQGEDWAAAGWPLERLAAVTLMNVQEFILAVHYGLDVEDKAADAANCILILWDLATRGRIQR